MTTCPTATGAAGAAGSSATGGTGGAAGAAVVPMSVPPVEWVGYHTEVPLDPSTFHALAAGLMGTDAQAGNFVPETEITTNVFIKSEAEPTTPNQARLTISYDDGEGNSRRVLAVAPASFAVGTVFVTTVNAALAKMQADNGGPMAKGQGESYYLEYRVHSAQGGQLSFGVKGNGGAYSLVLDVTSPHTSLLPASLGQAADTFGPYDSVAGTVNFHMSKDDFDFFVGHAYGAGATSKQNFTDFALVPHDWLRLTVTPHLDMNFVDVHFDVLGLDGSRTKVSEAPASVMAGGTFQTLVDRNMTTMLAQEKKMAGSSTAWTTPFYYDNPDGGGVVQVIAQGTQGIFSVAYSVESPHNPLMDVPFVAYVPVTIPPPDPNQNAACNMMGDPNMVLAPKGSLNITFSAADTVINSPDLKGPLVGTIYCSVFHASDVNIEGPIAGAMSLQDFNLPMANLQAMPPLTFVTNEVYAGDYQVLCFQDLDGDGNPTKGDPVTLPIGSYPVECNTNPAPVQFAILDPG
jgi:hypothetical protein